MSVWVVVAVLPETAPHRAVEIMMTYPLRQTGATLIEVLVAVLLLSFGLLSLGSMLAYGVQLPKLSAYRATATVLANSHIERIRANPGGFSSGNYTAGLNDTTDWSFSAIAISASNCSFAGTQCTVATLASADTNEFRNAVRRDLPAGEIVVQCSTTPCTSTSYGELWVIWQEPQTFAALSSASDNCPTVATTLYVSPKPSPRCVYIRFKV